MARELYLDDSWHGDATYFEVVEDVKGRPKHERESVLATYSLRAAKVKTPATRRLAARREATAQEKREYAVQFKKAKLEEWHEWSQANDVVELIDMRKEHCPNYITGRWVLTIKRDKDGKFLKCKARWVLRGFQDKQIWNLQTDSPTSTRPGFRLQCQLAADKGWTLLHLSLIHI